jgi:hypothetical protein
LFEGGDGVEGDIIKTMGLDGVKRERSENVCQRKHRQGYGSRWDLDGVTRERSENAGQRKHCQGYGCRWCDERKGVE